MRDGHFIAAYGIGEVTQDELCLLYTSFRDMPDLSDLATTNNTDSDHKRTS